MPDAPTHRGEHANNSFYTAIQFFSGFMFGATEYSLMTAHGARIDIVAFFLLALSPLVYLFAKKNRIIGRSKRAYALARPYRHILADFMFSASTVSMFSMLVFTITRSLPLIDRDMDLSIHAILLLLNVVMFVISILLFSSLAQEERTLIGGST